MHQLSYVRSGIGCLPLDYVCRGKKKRKEKYKQLWSTHGLRTFTNPTWMEIICKRCHCGLWAQLICQLSEGWASKGLNHLSNISGEVSPQPLGQDRESDQSRPLHRCWRDRWVGRLWGSHFLQKFQCSINVWGTGPAVEAEAWREAQGPSDQNWCHTWNMESINNGSFCFLERERT